MFSYFFHGFSMGFPWVFHGLTAPCPIFGGPPARGSAQLAPLRGAGARLRGAGRRGGSQAAAAQDAGGRFRELMGFLDGKSIGSIGGYILLNGMFLDFWLTIPLLENVGYPLVN